MTNKSNNLGLPYAKGYLVFNFVFEAFFSYFSFHQRQKIEVLICL